MIIVAVYQYACLVPVLTSYALFNYPALIGLSEYTGIQWFWSVSPLYLST